MQKLMNNLLCIHFWWLIIQPSTDTRFTKKPIITEGWNLKMKKIIAMLLALTMVLSMGALAFAAGDGEDAEVPELPDYLKDLDLPEFTTIEEGKLIMSTNAQFPPYEMVADEGKGFAGMDFAGIDVELAWYLAQATGLEPQIDDMEFDSALIAVQDNKSDMMLAGLTYNEERDEVMDFSTPYANGVQVVIVPEDSEIETIDDLANAEMIGTQSGTTGYIYCSYSPEDGGYGEDHVTAYDNGATAVQALLNGQIDAVVIDDGPAKEYVAANPGLKILDTEFTNEDYCLAVDQDNTALLEALNTVLETMIDNGLVEEIVSHYVSADEAE